MSRRTELLTDEQWVKIEALLPKGEIRRKRGRPRSEDRRVVEGILWGACGRVHAGGTFLIGIRAPQPAGEGSKDGKKRECG